jgi:hypothetical protein
MDPPSLFFFFNNIQDKFYSEANSWFFAIGHFKIFFCYSRPYTKQKLLIDLYSNTTYLKPMATGNQSFPEHSPRIVQQYGKLNCWGVKVLKLNYLM